MLVWLRFEVNVLSSSTYWVPTRFGSINIVLTNRDAAAAFKAEPDSVGQAQDKYANI